MKTKLSLSIFVSILVSVLFWFNSCKQENFSTDYSLKNMSQLVDKYNINRLGMDKGMIEKGKARIVSTQNDYYVVQFQNLQSAKNTFFALQAQNVVPDFNITFSEVELIHMGENLILNSLREDNKILLQLGNHFVYPEIANLKFKQKFSGTGLGKYPNFDKVFLVNENNLGTRTAGSSGGGFVGSGPIVPILPTSDLSCRCEENGSSDSKCKSGGSGSSSSSRSEGSGDSAKSCSVSCESGYFACCSDY